MGQDLLSRVIASETTDPRAALAVALTVLTRYKGDLEKHLAPGRSQGGSQHFSTRNPGNARSDVLASLARQLFEQGVRFYGATACFEFDEQLRSHLRDPSRWKHPVALHASWVARGERLVKVYRNWVFYSTKGS